MDYWIVRYKCPSGYLPVFRLLERDRFLEIRDHFAANLRIETLILNSLEAVAGIDSAFRLQVPVVSTIRTVVVNCKKIVPVLCL